MPIEPYNINNRINRLRKRKRATPGKDPRIQNRIDYLRKVKRGINTETPVDENPKAPNEPKPKKPKGQDNQSKGNQQNQGTPYETDRPDPRDDQYWADIARLQFDRDMATQELQTQNIFEKTQLEDTLSQLGRNEARDILATKQSANRGGALYSSATGEALGQVAQDYFSERSGLERGVQEAGALRDILLNRIQGGYELDADQAMAAAVARQAAMEMNRPSPIAPNIPTSLPKAPSKKQGGDKALSHKDRLAYLQKKMRKAKPSQRNKIRKRIKRVKRKV